MNVRFARPSDLPDLQRIEDAADRMFLDLFGDVPWPSATPGSTRAGQPGFVLVVGDPASGFAHVMEVAGEAHLEQVAVLPEQQRRGAGTALVRAAMAEAAVRGYTSITLRTYADVPWNAPFYARLGFVEEEPTTDFQRSLVAVEERMRLTDHGRRILMRADISG